MLKSFFVSGMFIGYYWLALRNKNFNYYNRFYLLLSIISSLVIPLFNFTWFTIEKEAAPVTHEKITAFTIQVSQTNSTPVPWLSILNYTVIGVSVALLAMFMLNIFKVYKLKRNSAVLKMDEIDFIYTDLEHAPFSFLNNLFWKESIPMDSPYGKKIFKHEITHINQKHTLDILFCQVVNAILWMNPFNWLIQKELKAIHEFIADKEAMGNSDAEDFARLLLQAHYGNHFLNPTHSFYYSSIKRRLIMLSTTHRTKFSYLRRVLVLPLSAMAIAALSISTTESKAAPVEAPIKPVITQQPLEPVVKNDTTPTPAKAKVQPAKKTKKETEEPRPELSGSAEQIIITDNRLKPELSIRAVDEVKFDSSKSTSDSTKKNSGTPQNALYIYDGKFISYEDLHKLEPNQIKSINVWKGESAIKKFGQLGANGVIELFSKKHPY
jgi:beta-lactamase regulating signal transducer with metallopeptidase domain